MRSPVSPDLVSISTWTADLQEHCRGFLVLWLPLGFGQQRCWQDTGGSRRMSSFLKPLASSLWSHIRLAVTLDQRSFDPWSKVRFSYPSGFSTRVSSSNCRCLAFFTHPLGRAVVLAPLLTPGYCALLCCGSLLPGPGLCKQTFSLQNSSNYLVMYVPSY